MLQRGLSNRPTGAVALLLLGAGYLLSLARTHDHPGFIAKTLFGAPVKDAMVLVQKAGAVVDRILVNWGDLLESESRHWGCVKKERLLVQRTPVVIAPVFDSSQAGGEMEWNCKIGQKKPSFLE